MAISGWNANTAAEEVLRALAEQELAFVWREAEARASDEPWPGQPYRIDPHVLGAARKTLVDKGDLELRSEKTHGGREITTYHPAEQAGRAEAIAQAAARKRLLDTRFRSWAEGNATFKAGGLVGPAAEKVLLNTLRDAAPVVGYRLLNPASGAATNALGFDIPGGPVDNTAEAFWGSPYARFTMLFEVKSRREHLYPTSSALYQALYKAAELSRLAPKEHVLPVIFCRRAHITTFRMAYDLGAYLIEARRQWLRPHSRLLTEHVAEVRNELSFLDLYELQADEIFEPLKRQLTKALPEQAERQADRWMTRGRAFVQEYKDLWNDGSRTHLGRIREEIKKQHWYQGGW